MAPVRRRRGPSAGWLAGVGAEDERHLESCGARPWVFPGVVPVADPKDAEWLISSLDQRWAQTRSTSTTVASMVPDHFQGYARIFHPVPPFIVGAVEDRAVRTTGPRALAWAEVAANTGRILHAGTQFHRLATAAPGHDAGTSEVAFAPPPAETPPEIVTLLAAQLSPYTTTPDKCWFALWEGYGDLFPSEPGSFYDGPARVVLPARTYLLYSGPVEAATAFARPTSPHSPTLWWPEDLAWFVGSDPDLDSTYLGADDSAVDGVVSLPGIEAIRTVPGQRVTFDSDDLNVD